MSPMLYFRTKYIKEKPLFLSYKGHMPNKNSVKITRDKNSLISQIMAQSYSSIILINLFKKHEKTIRTIYNSNTINDIINNTKTRITSKFKDYNIYDNHIDNLKHYYNLTESQNKFNYLIQYYSKKPKISPNYL